MHMHIHINIHIHTHKHTYTHTHSYTYTYINTYTHTHTHTFRACMRHFSTSEIQFLHCFHLPANMCTYTRMCTTHPFQEYYSNSYACDLRCLLFPIDCLTLYHNLFRFKFDWIDCFFHFDQFNTIKEVHDDRSWCK